jgi:hypothetical protein
MAGIFVFKYQNQFGFVIAINAEIIRHLQNAL